MTKMRVKSKRMEDGIEEVRSYGMVYFGMSPEKSEEYFDEDRWNIADINAWWHLFTSKDADFLRKIDWKEISNIQGFTYLARNGFSVEECHGLSIFDYHNDGVTSKNIDVIEKCHHDIIFWDECGLNMCDIDVIQNSYTDNYVYKVALADESGIGYVDQEGEVVDRIEI